MPTIILPPALNANSWVSLLAAEAILDDMLVARDEWDVASDDDRARALISAASGLAHGIAWHGAPSTLGQALPFPRITSAACDGHMYGASEIPLRVQQAQVLYAASLLTRLAAGQVSGGVDATAALKRVKAGSVEVEYRDGDTGVPYVAGRSIPDEVYAYVSCLGEREDGSGVNVRMVRG